MADVPARLSAALTDRYRIERELGAGGMATVYLAHDVRHERQVALKVLRPELAAILGAERFLKEIKTTANLQHPHILPLHDSGEVEGLVYYVMPFVEGESLRDRLQRDRQLPIDEALRIATEVADALDYAHRHGVVHRDIKPENVLLHDGRALVADFGIALAASRTEGSTRLTETGLSLGTPAYMAPEQAMGERDVTPRADVYALGCLTYEMLAGQPPFTGPTAQAIIAQVLTDQPRSLTAQRHTIPPHVESAVLQAVEKLPADRFATAREFAAALRDATFAPVRAPSRGVAAGTARVPWTGVLRHPLGMALAALAVAGLVLAAWSRLAPRTAEPSGPLRFVLNFPPGERWEDTPGSPVAISPDGELIAYVGSRAGEERMIFVRPLDQLTGRPVTGTEGGAAPFFSPDGRWIGFSDGNQIKKVPVDGGTPLPITTTSQGQGASWGPDGRIATTTLGRLAVVPPTGGEPQIVGQIDTAAGEVVQIWPMWLPDGKGLMYQSWPRTGVGGARIKVLDLDDNQSKDLDLPGTQPLGIVEGQLIYANASGAIMAVPFDVRRRRVVGAPVPVVDGVVLGGLGVLKGDLSADGSLVYVARGAVSQPLLLGGPRSDAQVLIPGQREIAHPRFSPDGRHLAVTITDTQSSDVWILDLPAGPLRRLTSGGALNDRPEWTPDGQSVVFRSGRAGRAVATGSGADFSLWIQRADGNRPAEEFFGVPDAGVYEGVISSDGAHLLFQRDSTGTGGRTWVRGLRGDTSARVVAAAPAGQQTAARFSPDGRWVAYQSDELGTAQVYVKPFPSLDARYQVSLESGVQPVWSRDSKRLFYLNGSTLMAATLTLTPTFAVTTRDSLLGGVEPGFGYHANYDVAPDGMRFAFVRSADQGAEIVVVHRWADELRARLQNAGR